MFQVPFLFLELTLKASIAFWESIGQATRQAAAAVEKTVRNSVELLRSFLQRTRIVHVSGNLYQIVRGAVTGATRTKHMAEILYMPARSAA